MNVAILSSIGESHKNSDTTAPTPSSPVKSTSPSQEPAKVSVPEASSDVSKDFWDRAYCFLKEDDEKKKLLTAYEEILVTQLKVTLTEVAGVGIGCKHALVSEFIYREQEAKGQAAKRAANGQKKLDVRTSMAEIVNAVVVVKGYGDRIATVEPHVGMAWAGISALLPVSHCLRESITMWAWYM